MEGTYTSYGYGDPETWGAPTGHPADPRTAEHDGETPEELAEMWERDGHKLDDIICDVSCHSPIAFRAALVDLMNNKPDALIALMKERLSIEAEREVDDRLEKQEAEWKKWREDMSADRQAA